MTDPGFSMIQQQLSDRRRTLASALATSSPGGQLQRLLEEVDLALERIRRGDFGLCETCHEPIEPERLMANPLVRTCVDHLTSAERRALEDDLVLAHEIQAALLPAPGLRVPGWEVAYHYRGAGNLSGDYCDLVPASNGMFYFVVGDVVGKGIAASMLMTQLNAMVRTLVSLELPLDQLLERAGRIFCESTLTSHYATLVCGRANPDGSVELCNAGHPPPLLAKEVDATQIEKIEATGLPLGMFCSERYQVRELNLSGGDTLLLYTDGLTEALDASESEYGEPRLVEFMRQHRALAPRQLVAACVEDLEVYQATRAQADDVTIMVIRRLDPAGPRVR